MRILERNYLDLNETILGMNDKEKTIDVEVVNISDNNLPQYASPWDSGCDIRVDFSRIETIDDIKHFPITNNDYKYTKDTKTLILPSLCRCICPTGIFVSIPHGYEIQVRSRSGLSINLGVIILNSPGTIDSTYRGEIGLIVSNTSDISISIENGVKLAQLVLSKIDIINWITKDTVNDFSSNENRGGGFGHSDDNGI